MDDKEVFQYVDHTLLQQTATWEEIKKLCDDGIKYQTASVCIPPSFVEKAKKYVGDKMKICTVIGFPNGYNTTAVKVFETKDAVKNGADEIDMVINLGMVKEKKWGGLEEEIRAVKSPKPNQKQTTSTPPPPQRRRWHTKLSIKNNHRHPPPHNRAAGNAMITKNKRPPLQP